MFSITLKHIFCQLCCDNNDAEARERSDRGRFLPIRKKSLFLIARAVHARPISTIPGSMEACEYGLTRGTCFVARCRCLEVVAVGGLLWISCCVLGAAGFFAVLFYFYSSYFFFERTRPAASMRQPCLIYLSTSNEARPKERSDQGHFLPIGKKASS